MVDSEVEEHMDMNLVDENQLDDEARKVAKAEGLADDLEKVQKRIDKVKRETPEVGQNKGMISGGGQGRLSSQFQQTPGAGVMMGNQQQLQGLVNKVDKLDDTLDEVTDKIDEVSVILADPISFFARKIGSKFGPITKIAAIIMATKIAYEAVVGFVMDMFKPGSALDIRKLVLDQVKSIPALKAFIDIKNGKMFFTADTRITQHPAQTSNTENLVDGHMRYNYERLGNVLGEDW